MKSKCDISKCHAACCYNVPHSKFTLFTNKKRTVNQYSHLLEQEACDNEGRKLFLPVVSTDSNKNKCPFLREDCKCNIYGNRPWLCRVFGTPPPDIRKSKFLKCGWLNGKECDNNVANKGDIEDSLTGVMEMFLNGIIKL